MYAEKSMSKQLLVEEPKRKITTDIYNTRNPTSHGSVCSSMDLGGCDVQDK